MTNHSCPHGSAGRSPAGTSPLHPAAAAQIASRSRSPQQVHKNQKSNLRLLISGRQADSGLRQNDTVLKQKQFSVPLLCTVLCTDQEIFVYRARQPFCVPASGFSCTVALATKFPLCCFARREVSSDESCDPCIADFTFLL